MPVRVMLAQMSAYELAEYMAFDRIEPIGEPRADLRAGIIASAIVNHSMAPPKAPAKPLDFMPFAAGARRGPIKLSSAVEHAKLLARSLFQRKGDPS